MTTALFVGRFQPLHKGHLLAIQEILETNSKIILAIGSSQESNTFVNPFSAGERRHMIKEALNEEFIDESKYEIIEVPDAQNDSEWVNSVISKAEFDVVYTSENVWTRKCFSAKGIKVKLSTYVEPYKGDAIRKKILEGMSWKDLVPESVYKYIQSIGGDERIQHLGS